MATSHIIDSLIAACNDCEVKYVGIMKKITKNIFETQDVETIIPEKDV